MKRLTRPIKIFFYLKFFSIYFILFELLFLSPLLFIDNVEVIKEKERKVKINKRKKKYKTIIIFRYFSL